MSITKKLLIALGICLLVVVIFMIALAGIFFYLQSDKDLARATEASEVEGHDFGKTTDQRGCMKEGLARATTSNDFKPKLGIVRGTFIRACLESSRPAPGFCDGVPKRSLANPSNYDWTIQQCEKIRMDSSKTGCKLVFDEQARFCEHD